MGSGCKAYLEERLRLQHEATVRLEEELQKEIRLEKKFKKLRKCADQTVISWAQKFRKHGITYVFVAIKIKDNWYTTSLFQDKAMTTQELVDKHLQYAEEGTILAVSDWSEYING